MCILFDPRVPPVEISSKEIVGLKFKANHTRMFTAALFNYLKTGNNKCTPLGDQLWYIHMNLKIIYIYDIERGSHYVTMCNEKLLDYKALYAILS